MLSRFRQSLGIPNVSAKASDQRRDTRHLETQTLLQAAVHRHGPIIVIPLGAIIWSCLARGLEKVDDCMHVGLRCRDLTERVPNGWQQAGRA